MAIVTGVEAMGIVMEVGVMVTPMVEVMVIHMEEVMVIPMGVMVILMGVMAIPMEVMVIAMEVIVMATVMEGLQKLHLALTTTPTWKVN